MTHQWIPIAAGRPQFRGEVRVWIKSTQHRPEHSEIRCFDYVVPFETYCANEGITHYQFVGGGPE